ncbi:DUF2336 domain-containing protein [Microbaculum sp. FT89]|uniref:DUF2336 domain-containing protein n=1 Tax=Microbaculum sp. FT89 TaxID=3447298 RepID=UPI003F53BA1C
MLVRRFLDRLSQGNSSERADIVRALVRVFLEAQLDERNRADAIIALTAILDDPSARVRRVMAEGLADTPDAPPVVIRALAEDQADIAAIILSRSPVLSESELVDIVGGGYERARVAIATRPQVSVGLAAAIAEVGGPDACVALVDNPGATVTVTALRRMVDRHRHDATVRNALLERPELPVTLRQKLIDGLSEALGELVALHEWMPPERAGKVMSDARDRAVVDLAMTCEPARLRSLVEMLAAERRMTPALMIRALCLGNVQLVEEALSVLSGTPVKRVLALIDDRSGRGLAALYRRAKLPAASLPALRAVVAVLREDAPDGSLRRQVRMGQRMLERALTLHQSFTKGEVDEFFALIGRLAAEAAREEARSETGGYFWAA